MADNGNMIDATIGADGALKVSFGGAEHAKKTTTSAADGEAEKKEMEVEKEEVTMQESADVAEEGSEQSKRMKLIALESSNIRNDGKGVIRGYLVMMQKG